MNILITGASGFLGSTLAHRLSGKTHHISLLVRKNTNLLRLGDLTPYNIGRCETDDEIKQFISSVCPDIVIHAACCYGRHGESMLQIVDSNFWFGTVILNALKDLKKKITFINSGTVLSRDVSLYALTKIQFEEFGEHTVNSSDCNMQFINIKLQHMYGPGDDASKFTTHVIYACKNNVQTLPLTLGEQRRDFIYIDDVVDAYVKIIENLTIFNVYQEIELGSGVSPRVREFVEMAHKITNSKTKLLFGQLPYRENDVMCMVANIGGLKRLGWAPNFDIEAGIKKIIEMDGAK